MFQHDQWGAAVHGQFLGHAAVEEAFQEPRVPVQYRHRIGVLPLASALRASTTSSPAPSTYRYFTPTMAAP